MGGVFQARQFFSGTPVMYFFSLRVANALITFSLNSAAGALVKPVRWTVYNAQLLTGALLAAHGPYGMIQALARWRSDKSVAIYARLNPNDYAGWVTKALQQKTTSRTAARLPVVIDDHDNVATYQLACTHAQRRAAAADED